MIGKAVAMVGAAGCIGLVALADHPNPNAELFNTKPVGVPGTISSSLPPSPGPEWHPAPASQVTTDTTTPTSTTKSKGSSSPTGHLTGFAACWAKYRAGTRSKPC